MAIILNLETATTNCSVSLARDGELVAIREHDDRNYSHAEKLHVFIDEVVQEAGFTYDMLNAIAVSKGPGSYTGLRIGVSAAKGLCFVLDIPLVSVATLKSMAHQVSLASDDIIVPMLDARRMEVYSCVFDHLYGEIRETRAEVVNGESFGDFLKESGHVHLVGSGAEKCRQVLDDARFLFNTSLIPSAREMALLSYQKYSDGQFVDVAYFEPYYLKDFIVQKKGK
ncbi:MAG: tRNA (adenosine(37)-N6)-threonylcarbamoyltransferase complex dimerization subunit type 1 TsaB [Flavobacteriaceae bacterium]